MTLLLVLVVVAVGTYGFRVSMVLARERFGTPAWLEPRLRLVAPAVLAALVASSLFIDSGTRSVPGMVEAIAVVAGFVAVRRTGNVAAALAVGLPVYWLGALTGLA
jgi:branched-subunit amino acid transport protein